MNNFSRRKYESADKRDANFINKSMKDNYTENNNMELYILKGETMKPNRNFTLNFPNNNVEARKLHNLIGVNNKKNIGIRTLNYSNDNYAPNKMYETINSKPTHLTSNFNRYDLLSVNTKSKLIEEELCRNEIKLPKTSNFSPQNLTKKTTKKLYSCPRTVMSQTDYNDFLMRRACEKMTAVLKRKLAENFGFILNCIVDYRKMNLIQITKKEFYLLKELKEAGINSTEDLIDYINSTTSNLANNILTQSNGERHYNSGPRYYNNFSCNNSDLNGCYLKSNQIHNDSSIEENNVKINNDGYKYITTSYNIANLIQIYNNLVNNNYADLNISQFNSVENSSSEDELNVDNVS